MPPRFDFKHRVVLVWTANLMLTMTAVYLSTTYLTPGVHLSGIKRDFWFSGMFAWDGGWYMNIAENGYISIQSTAFFPLYPMLIAAVSYLTGFGTGVSAVLISNVTFLAALYFLHKFIAAIWDRSVADKSILLAALFPGTMFFTMAYTEAMTLFLTALFFWMLHQGNRGLWQAHEHPFPCLPHAGHMLSKKMVVHRCRYGAIYEQTRLNLHVQQRLLGHMIKRFWI